MYTSRFHVPMPDPRPQPQPVPHPGAPPAIEPGALLPLPMVPVSPLWRYRQLDRTFAEVAQGMSAELDALGGEGWELAGVTADGQTVHFFFKKQVR